MSHTFFVSLAAITTMCVAVAMCFVDVKDTPDISTQLVKKPNTYRAAVYEHPIVMPIYPAKTRAKAIQQMMVNLREYEKQATRAGNQEVDILVFPEDGIYGNALKTREYIAIYMETMPDPRVVSWIPCDDPSRFAENDVQVFLSCLAKNNSLYLVANFGDVQPCVTNDPNCPSDGQYQYNTDVVYDKAGKFIAKYHKQNLFFETQFNEPINPEYVYFDTDFGRFGVFTCFDILFHEPAIPLVEYFNITDVVFPTAWMDVLPYFSAIGYHSSFAVAHRVNLLAANLHNPLFNFQGSGIYTPTGANLFYYNRTPLAGRLLISDVDVNVRKNSESSVAVNNKNVLLNNEMHSIQLPEFKSTVFYDWYDFVMLTASKGNVTICQKGFCCFLHYEKEQTNDNYAFGAFNGIHVHQGPYFLQNCLLIRCASGDKQSCDGTTHDAHTKFYSFQMTGNFSSAYIHPQIVLSNSGSLELPKKGLWNYGRDGLTGQSAGKPLLSVSLIGRVYVRD